MTNSTIRVGAVTALGLTLAALAASGGLANQDGFANQDAVQCGVASSSEGGMLALEGTVLSPVAVSGEYRLSIRSASGGGSSNISQGGHFNAAANEATALGKVMVNAGSSVDIDFSVTANGKDLDCNQEIASR